MIQVKSYTDLGYNFSEILRYANADEKSLPILSECIKEAENVLSYKVCYGDFPVKIDGDTVITPVFSAKSSALAKNLSGCEKVLVFGATIGIGFDRLIARGEYYSPEEARITELKNEYDAQDECSSPEEWFDKWCNKAIDKELVSFAYKQDYENHRYVKRITAIEEDYENGKIDIWTAIYAVRETRGEAVESANVSWLEK